MFEFRPSTYDCCDHYWQMWTDEDGEFPQSATVQWGFIFVESAAGLTAVLVGPRTLPAVAPYYRDQHYWAIVMHGHSELTEFPKFSLLNRMVSLPVDGSAFRLGPDWRPIPAYDEFDSFIGRLLKSGALVVNQVVAESIVDPDIMTTRTRQRKFKLVTGLTPKQIEQSNRVMQAIELLVDGSSLADVAVETGFADQGHMTREFRKLIGRTPGQIRAYFS